ncbi:HAD-IA family hydrolase [Frigoribacterium sp. 2-23]|uniref:HAD-IA family hydrolase n=1 Tax=Frigoribacterium sp. 2-23 TaxID=3415006 RepID=UPI003C6ED664
MTVTLTARALLFDMDGTLVDSTATVERVWAGFAERHGVDLTELLAFSHGRQTLDTVERFLPDADAATQRREVDGLVGGEHEGSDDIVEIPGAAALLAAVEALPEARVAIVTSAPHALALARIRGAGLPVPEVLVAADDVATGKPSPEGYLRAAELLGVEPGDCIVFEDAGAGLEAGRASGATVVVVGDHAGPAADGLARIADYTDVRVAAADDGRIALTFG